MRTLVYKAAAYGALLMAGAEAFAPQSCGPRALAPASARAAGKQSGGMQMMGDARDVLARADAMMQGKDALMNGKSLQTVAASLETSYKAPPASGSSWKPYGGYDPKNRAAAPASAPAEMARAYAAAAPAPARTQSAPSSGRKIDYGAGGYNPQSRGAPAADSNAVMARVSQMMGSSAAPAAPAKSWAPPQGYVPSSAGAL